MARVPFLGALCLLSLLVLFIQHSNAQCTSSAVASTDTPGGANLTLPLRLSPGGGSTNPSTQGLIRIDVMLVYDTNGGNRNELSLLAGYTEARVGFATCTTTSSTNYTSTVTSVLQPSATTVAQSVPTDALTPSVTPVFGVNCIRDMMYANVGWRQDAYRIVALLSANPQNFALDLTNDIYATNIVPLFFMSTPSLAVQTAIENYARTLPIAYTAVGFQDKQTSNRYSKWSSDVSGAIDSTTTFVTFGRTSNTPLGDSFIFTIPPRQALPLNSVLDVNVTIGYPSGLNPTSVTSVVTSEVTAYGFSNSASNFLITVIQPPAVFNATYFAEQGSDVSFTISAIVPSEQSLRTVFTAVNNGDILATSLTGGALALNTLHTGLSFVFRPVSTFIGVTTVTFYVNDGCQRSAAGSLSFNFTKSNAAPQAASFPVTIPYNSALAAQQHINFTNFISDANDGISGLTISINSLPSTTLGTLILDDGSNTVITAVPYVLGLGRTLRFVPSAFRSGSTSFLYSVSDGSLTSSNGTVSITIPFTNTVPVVNVTQTSFSAEMGTFVTFTLSARDQDLGEQLSLVVTASNLGSQSVALTGPAAGNTVTSASTLPFTLLANRAPSTATGFVHYAMRWTVGVTTDFITAFTFTAVVRDLNGGESAATTFSFTVLPRCDAGFFVSSLVCTPCQNGSTSAGGNMTTCTACPTGTYSNSTTGWICQSCNSGFIPTGIQDSCSACPAGYYQVGSECVLCAPGLTSSGAADTCVSCNSSTYSDSTSLGICVYCPDGSIPNATLSGCTPCAAGTLELADTCVSCPAGNTSTVGSTSCSDCQDGSYSNAGTSFQCTQCPAGTYSNVPRRDGCTVCEAGFTSTTGSAAAAGQCTPCPVATYSDPDVTQGLCVACPLGYIPTNATEVSGNRSCIICPAGTYAFEGLFCAPCPDGSSSQAGSFSLSQCSNCSLGEYANSTTNGVCTACPAGTYSLGDRCTYCPSGTSSTSGSASNPAQCTSCNTDQVSSPGTFGLCAFCPEGFVPNAARNECVICPAGFVESSSGGACTICPNGTTSTPGLAGTSSCTICPPGSTSSPLSNGLCVICPAQTYSDQFGICQPCAPGSISAANSSACTACQNGTFSQNGQCVLCPVGQTSLTNSTTCFDCPDGFFSNATTAGLCSACAIGTREINGRCFQCPAGTFSELNSTVCTNCSAGSYSNTGNSGCEICPPGTTAIPGTAGAPGSCTLCPPGTFSNLTTSGICFGCPDGFKPTETQGSCIVDPRPPTLVQIPASFSFDQGTTRNVTLSASDRDSEDYLTLAMLVTAVPSSGPMFFQNAVVDSSNPFSPGSSFEAATNTSRFNMMLVPDASFFGSDIFVFEASDRTGLVSESGSVSFTVIHVNHQPETYNIQASGLAESTVRINDITFYDFDGSYDTHSLVIEDLPALGTLTTGTGAAIVAGEPIPAENGRWTLLFRPVTGTSNEFGPYTTWTFKVCDNSMVAATNCSAVATATMYIAPINRLPTSMDQNMTTMQNQAVRFDITASDPDTWDPEASLRVIISSFSGLGSFFLDANLSNPAPTLTPMNPRTLWYMPPRNVYSPNAQTPLGSFRFRVIDGNQTLSSVAYTFAVVVTHVPQPPEFVGSNVVRVTQNVAADLLLTTLSQFVNTNQGFNASYSTQITTIPARGSLAVCGRDNVCTYISRSGAAVLTSEAWNVGESNGRVVFLPDFNTFGADYSFFEYKVTDNVGQSATVRININVERLNQRPFFLNATWVENSVVLVENGTAIVSVLIADVDSDPTGAVLSVSTRSGRLAWNLYSCEAGSDTTSCIRGASPIASSANQSASIAAPSSELKTTSCQRPAGFPVTDFSSCYKKFVFEFVPEQRRWSYQYAQIFVQPIDSEGRDNDVVPLFVVVLPRNDPPTITGPPKVTAPVGVSSITLVDDARRYIEIDDFDASRSDVLGVNFELIGGSIGEFRSNSSGVRCGVNQTASIAGLSAWTCNGTMTALNQMLRVAKWEMNVASSNASVLVSRLRVTVNDYGASSEDRMDPKTAEMDMEVEYTRPANIVQDQNASTWWIILVVIAAVALLVAIALIVWRLRSRFASPDDGYFSVAATGIHNANENPMFKPATTEGFNKLFNEEELSADQSVSYSESE